MDRQTEMQNNEVLNQGADILTFRFNIILKFWKKSSKSFEAVLQAKNCLDQESFLLHLKEKYQIKSSHCLEEVWVLQKSKPTERKIEWIKAINGRIKIHVPDSYKEFLLKKSATKGKHLFEDPSYEE